ncbi:hypothetical protein PPHE_b0037 [Pseudoalteromonas phenolica O-BC30]|nr:hypothetical protein [Pseudoalteromonas phenolica O-BC30]
MKRKNLILLVLFLGALSCYILGFVLSAGLFIVLAVILELVFWFGLFRKSKT